MTQQQLNVVWLGLWIAYDLKRVPRRRDEYNGYQRGQPEEISGEHVWLILRKINWKNGGQIAQEEFGYTTENEQEAGHGQITSRISAVVAVK